MTFCCILDCHPRSRCLDVAEYILCLEMALGTACIFETGEATHSTPQTRGADLRSEPHAKPEQSPFHPFPTAVPEGDHEKDHCIPGHARDVLSKEASKRIMSQATQTSFQLIRSLGLAQAPEPETADDRHW